MHVGLQIIRVKEKEVPLQPLQSQNSFIMPAQFRQRSFRLASF